MIVIPTPELVNILTQLTDVGGRLAGALLGLYKQELIPGPQTTLADMVAIEADFPGYARTAPLAWANPFIGGDGTALVLAGSVQIDCTGVTDQNIYGYFLVKPAVVGPPAVPASLLFAERFPNSIPITGPTNSVALWPRFTFGQ